MNTRFVDIESSNKSKCDILLLLLVLKVIVIIMSDFTLNIYLFCLFGCEGLGVVCGIFNYSMQTLSGIKFPNQGSNPGSLRWES